MTIFLGILLLIFMFLEGTVTTLPLVLLFLLCLTIIKRDARVFSIAFGAGLLLDILTVHTLGTSSLFFVAFVFVLLLYQGKYEIHSYPFVVAASFFGSLLFLFLFGTGNRFVQAGISSLIGIFLFTLFQFLQTKYKIRQTI